MLRPVKKELGQHFLVDRNVLGVIERLAELGPEDVVLEVGPGQGVLTAYLADRVRHVHAVELDRSLDEPLRAALEGRTNVSVLFEDAHVSEEVPVWAVTAPGRHRLPRVQVFVDFLASNAADW